MVILSMSNIQIEHNHLHMDIQKQVFQVVEYIFLVHISLTKIKLNFEREYGKKFLKVKQKSSFITDPDAQVVPSTAGPT